LKGSRIYHFLFSGLIFFSVFNFLPANTKDLGEFTSHHEKPVISVFDLKNLKIEKISVSLNEASFDRTEITTEMLVNNSNLYLLPLRISCEVTLNEVKILSIAEKELDIRKYGNASLVSFKAEIKNENIIRWWISHINQGEQTDIKIKGKLFIPLDKVDIVFPFVYEKNFKTDILQGLNKKDVVIIRPCNFKIQQFKSKWGKVDFSFTRIEHEITIKNVGILPGQPITDIEYILQFNRIQMAKGEVGLPLLILPGQKRSLSFILKIPNENIIRWWVSHIQNGERTEYSLKYRMWVKPFGRGGWNSISGVFESKIFSLP